MDINWISSIYNRLRFNYLINKKECFPFTGEYEHRKSKQLQTVNCVHACVKEQQLQIWKQSNT